MLNQFFARHKYRFLLAASCIVIALFTFSFTEKGGRSDESFRGFCEAGTPNGADSLPGKKIRQGVSVDDTDHVDNRTIEQQIEETLNKVEERLERLEEELEAHYGERADEAYKLALNNAHLKRASQEARRSLMMAQANYDRAMRQFQMENKRQMSNMRMQMDRARDFARNYNYDLRVNVEAKVKANLAKAKDNMRKANEKLNRLKEFRNDLEKDGLIKKDGSYRIEIKDGSLYINEKKQSKKINKRYKDKYGEYFEEGNHFNLQYNKSEERREREGGLI